MFRSLATIALVGAALLAGTPASAQDTPFSSCKPSDITRMQGSSNEAIEGRPGALRYTFTGSPVIMPCNDTVLQANQIVYESDTRAIHATGNVLLQQPGLTIFAQRADMNGLTKLGTFYNATGLAKIPGGPSQKSMFGTLEPDFVFTGEIIEKTGPKSYRIQHGSFTTCVQPTPRWEMVESDASITLDKHAVLKNVVLRVKDVPLFYLPALYYPINKEDRSTGFLLPTYGSSTVTGPSISNAFFWAISRSQDMTLYHNWFSKSGQSVSAEYRYIAAPGSQGNVTFTTLDERQRLAADGSVERSAHRSYTIQGQANEGLRHGFRFIGQTNYFDDVSTQQLYQQNVYDSSNRVRSISASLSGGLGRFRLTASGNQQDVFYGTTEGQRTGQAPFVNLSLSDRPIGHTKIYVKASGETAYLIRQDNVADPTTNRSLWRMDGGPSVRAPLGSLSFLTGTATAAYQVTEWGESIDPATGLQVPVSLGRQLLTMTAQFTGPIFSRIFQTPHNHYADRFKHSIEPNFSIQRTSSFQNFNRVVQTDSLDTQVGGDTTITYGVTNRILARRVTSPAAPGAAPQTGGAPAAPQTGGAQTLLSVDIGQRYYSNALAASYDTDYQSNASVGTAPPGTFSPLAIHATVRPTNTASADFRTEIDAKFRRARTMSASGSIDVHVAQITASWNKQLVIPGLPGFDDPTQAIHYLNANTAIKTRDNHIGGSYSLNYDILHQSLLQQRIIGYYNSQCCGLSFDYQVGKTFLSSVPTNRTFNISFTLAGIGSFANPFGSFGGR